MISSIIKGAVIGAIIGFLILSLIKSIAKSKTVERRVDKFDRTIDGYIETPILSSSIGKFGGFTVNEDNLYFIIGAEFMKPNKFSIPYDKVLRCELCGEFESKDTPPELDDIPNRFVVEFIMDDGSQHTLIFDQTNIKADNLPKLYPNNIFDVINERIEKAKNTSPSTDCPSKK